jgi:glutaredoxin
MCFERRSTYKICVKGRHMPPPIVNLCRDAEFVRRLQRYREAFEANAPVKGGGRKPSGLPKPQPGSMFTVYGIETCPYCQEAETSLLAYAAAHPRATVKYYMLGNASTTPRNAISSYSATSKQDARAALSGAGGFNPDTHATFPIVFRRGTFLGGNDALQRILQQEAQ